MYVISPGTGYKTHPCTVQAQDLLKIATQVASGMNFLAERKVTHRCLCARNILVGTGLQVKVYNYGQKADNEVSMCVHLFFKACKHIIHLYNLIFVTHTNFCVK